jgi:hypothetical protein
MNDVKIVRLKNGNDVIGFVTEKLDGSLFIMEPMEITIHTEGKYSGLILKNWLPASLIKLNEATIKTENIICIMEANEEFSKYYSNSVSVFNERMKLKDTMSKMKEEEVDAMMEAYNELSSEEHIIH